MFALKPIANRHRAAPSVRRSNYRARTKTNNSPVGPRTVTCDIISKIMPKYRTNTITRNDRLRETLRGADDNWSSEGSNYASRSARDGPDRVGPVGGVAFRVDPNWTRVSNHWSTITRVDEPKSFSRRVSDSERGQERARGRTVIF